jgi:hypothetical protein
MGRRQSSLQPAAAVLAGTHPAVAVRLNLRLCQVQPAPVKKALQAAGWQTELAAAAVSGSSGGGTPPAGRTCRPLARSSYTAGPISKHPAPAHGWSAAAGGEEEAGGGVGVSASRVLGSGAHSDAGLVALLTLKFDREYDTISSTTWPAAAADEKRNWRARPLQACTRCARCAMMLLPGL